MNERMVDLDDKEWNIRVLARQQEIFIISCDDKSKANCVTLLGRMNQMQREDLLILVHFQGEMAQAQAMRAINPFPYFNNQLSKPLSPITAVNSDLSIEIVSGFFNFQHLEMFLKKADYYTTWHVIITKITAARRLKRLDGLKRLPPRPGYCGTLPLDLCRMILSFCPPIDLQSGALACTEWYEQANEVRKIYLRERLELISMLSTPRRKYVLAGEIACYVRTLEGFNHDFKCLSKSCRAIQNSIKYNIERSEQTRQLIERVIYFMGAFLRPPFDNCANFRDKSAVRTLLAKICTSEALIHIHIEKPLEAMKSCQMALWYADDEETKAAVQSALAQSKNIRDAMERQQVAVQNL